MSRAFVKEDAEPAPIQWRRTAPAAPGARLPLTRSGATRLQAELQRLKSASGPLENSEAARRIALLEDALARAEIVDVGAQAGARVKFGATVVLQDIDSGAPSRYRIVGELEADLKLGRIGVGSPLGQALIGREVGDLVQVRTPRGEREYEILEVDWTEEEGPAADPSPR